MMRQCSSLSKWSKSYIPPPLTRSGGNHQNNFETFIGKYRPQSSGSQQSNQLFRGKLDNIGVWNRALTDAEIAQLYTLEIDTTPPTVSLREKFHIELS